MMDIAALSVIVSGIASVIGSIIGLTTLRERMDKVDDKLDAQDEKLTKIAVAVGVKAEKSDLADARERIARLEVLHDSVKRST